MTTVQDHPGRLGLLGRRRPPSAADVDELRSGSATGPWATLNRGLELTV